MRDPDDLSYLPLATRQQRDKAFQTLDGILDGISADGSISLRETNELRDWATGFSGLKRDKAFREAFDAVLHATADGVLTADEIADLRFLCRNASSSSEYFDDITQSIQRLHGTLHGIVADQEIKIEELSRIQEWMDRHEHLRGVFPITEIEAAVVSVLTDGVVHEHEHEMLHQFFELFVKPSENYVVTRLRQNRAPLNFTGVCAIAPSIEFSGKRFCFTGIPSRATRKEMMEIASARGGIVENSVVKALDYLVVCENGNPCWAMSCYGRKVEKAMEMRRNGAAVLLVREVDFFDT